MAANKTKPTDVSLASFVNALAEPAGREGDTVLVGFRYR
jgi:hypothetical protein